MIPTRVRLLATLGAVLCVSLLPVAPARAHGDPASDFLLSQAVFVPFDGKFPAAAGELSQLVQRAKASGYEVRVAVIPTRSDLGAVTSLWRQPQRYALFLGQELYFVYRGRLLVVMPNGYGVAKGGKADPEMSKAIAGLAPPRGGGPSFAPAAEQAVRRLARAGGVTVSADGGNGGHGSTRDRVLLGAAALAALALLGAAALRRRRRGAA